MGYRSNWVISILTDQGTPGFISKMDLIDYSFECSDGLFTIDQYKWYDVFECLTIYANANSQAWIIIDRAGEDMYDFHRYVVKDGRVTTITPLRDLRLFTDASGYEPFREALTP